MVRWLQLCLFMVVAMIFLGGLTRLTNSGLSIVEWQPVTGILPPLNEHDWELEFSKYKVTPEYQQHNYLMNIADFKFIFYLEFIHRLVARITGLIYLLPMLYFYFTGKLKASNLSYLAVLILFFLQGFMGWYMVKSGLKDLPTVSHFRLACHLIIAVIIYTILFWQLMKLSCPKLLPLDLINLSNCKIICLVSLIIIYGQIFLGALVAGLDAGLIYNSFPLMGDSFIPPEVTATSFSLSDPACAQFAHRLAAYLLIIVIAALGAVLLSSNIPRLTSLAYYIIAAVTLQTIMCIFAVLYMLPISIALFHQLGAILLLSCLLWCYFLVRGT